MTSLNFRVVLAVSFLLSGYEALIPQKRENDSRPLCACEGGTDSHKTRVVGGRDAEEGEFPYATGLVSTRIIRSFWGSYLSSFCGATLITDRHVVTAAHCVRNRKSDDVALDISDYDMQDDDNMNQIRGAISLKKHPDYVKAGFQNDIAVIEFDEPVPLGENIKTAWLPPPHHELEPGTTLTVYGWGRLEYYGSRPSVLQTVQIPVMDYDECQSAYHTKIRRSEMICAGGEDGKDACIGDSGSGLLARMDNEYVLVGTVSFGKKCALPDVPGVYSKVSTYVDWIYEQTRNASCQPCIASKENFD